MRVGSSRSAIKNFAHKFRIDGQSLPQLKSFRFGPLFQLLKMRPRALRIDEIRSQWRNPAPIVDARVEQMFIVWIRKIRRRLDVHSRHEQPCDGDGPQHLAASWFGPIAHWNMRLGPKILNNDFLNMSVAVVQITNGEQRIYSVFR